MALQGWEKQPSLIELENLLANQEALEQQMSKVTIKPPENEEALFSAKKVTRKNKNRYYSKDSEDRERRCKHCGHKSDSEEEKEEYRRRPPNQGECFICGRKGHYARECRFLKNIQNNLAKLEYKNKESEEVWDFEATYAVDEEASEGECDFEGTCTVEEDVAEEEEWDLLGQNEELWIEELETDDNLETTTTSIIVGAVDDQPKDDVSFKTEDGGYMETNGVKLSEEEIELAARKSGAKKKGEPAEGNKAKIQTWLTNRRPPNQVKHAEFDVGANVKRPPERAEQLGIKGEC